MRRSSKWLAAVAGLVLAVLVVAWGGLVYGLNSARGRRAALAFINKRIAGRIELAGHQIRLLGGRVVLEGLVVHDPGAEPVATVKRVELSIRWPALIGREIRLDRLWIIGADIILNQEASGELTLRQALQPVPEPEAQQPKKTESGSAWQFGIDDVKIKDSAITYRRTTAGTAVSLESLSVDGRLNLSDGSALATVRIGRLSLSLPEGEHAFENLSLTGAYDAAAARPVSLTLETRKSTVGLDASLPTAPGQAIDARARLDIDLAELPPWLAGGYQPAGRLNGRITASGPVQDPDGSVTLALENGQIDDIRIEAVDLALDLHQRKATLRHLKISEPWGQAELSGIVDLRPVFAESFSRRSAGIEELTYDLTLTGREMRPAQLPALAHLSGVVGDIRLEIHGRGVTAETAAGQMAMDLQVRVPEQTDGAGAPAGDLKADITWQNRNLDIRTARARLFQNSLNLAGTLDLAAGEMDLDADAELAGLSQISTLLKLSLPAAKARVALTARGQWTSPDVRTEALLWDLALDKWRLGRVVLRAEAPALNKVTVSHLVLENQGSLIEGRGEIGLRDADGGFSKNPELSVDLRLSSVAPRDFGLQGDFQAELSGNLVASGTVRDPSAELTLGNSIVGWRKARFQTRGRLHWTGKRLAVEDLNLEHGDEQIVVQGALDWEPSDNAEETTAPDVTAAIRLNRLELENLLPRIAGRVTGQARLQGRTDALSGTCALQGGNLDIYGQFVQKATLNGHLADNIFYVDTLVASLAPQQEIKARGRLGFDGDFELSLTSDPVELERINALQKAYPVNGRLLLQADGRGSLKEPDVSASIEVREPLFKEQPFEDFSLEARLRNHRLTLDGDLNFELQANADLSSGDISAKARFRQTDLTPYLALWGGGDWAGQCSGDLELNGNWNDIGGFRLDLDLAEAVLRHKTVSLLEMQQLSAQLEKGRLHLPPTRIRLLQEGFVNLAAGGVLSRDLRTTIDGRLPLAALAPFQDAVTDVGGAVVIEARTKGPLKALEWEADLTFDRIRFTLPELYQSVRDLTGRISVTPEQVTVQQVKAAAATGTLTLDGTVAMEELKPVGGKLTLQARTLPVQWPDYLDAVLNADLTLSGDASQALLQGDIVLLEGVYYRDIRLNPLSAFSALTEKKRAQQVPVQTPKPQWMRHVTLAVGLGYRNPFLVDNNLANLQIAPDMEVGGTLAQPVISGRAQVVDGELLYRRKAFTIERGVVDFVSPYTTEAYLDIVSRAKIRQWDVTLSLSGPPDQLSFTLQSDPPLPDGDILSLILVGRTGEELMSGNGGSRQTTEQMLAALVSTAWGEDIKKTAGVDILEVETGSRQDRQDRQDADRIQVTVGKKLSRRLTLKYEVETGQGEMVQRAISEYQFLEHLLASGFQDSNGDYGGELLFRIEFR